MIKLSVVIPVYGVERYISRCLDSVFAINLPEAEYEVICVDDCTRDQSVQIVEDYQHKHENLRLLHHSMNKRQGGARNTGISHAVGRFMLFVDGDDSLPQYDLSGLLNYMEENQLDVLLGSANILYENGMVKRWGNAPLKESAIMAGPDLFLDNYVHKVAFGTVWLGIYRSDHVKRMRPFVENVPYEDADWTLQCAYESKLIQFKPVVVYNYIQNPVSTTHVASISKVIARLKQNFRVWEWAESTTVNRDSVLVAVKDFCVFNLRILKSLWQYKTSERRELYSSFSCDEWETMACWLEDDNRVWSFFIRHPLLPQSLLCFTRPILKTLRFVKRVTKNNKH